MPPLVEGIPDSQGGNVEEHSGLTRVQEGISWMVVRTFVRCDMW